MAQPIPDLWPDDFGQESEPSPVSILRQQGMSLGQRTQNFVLGKVYSRGIDQKTFEHTFALYAPLLGYERPILGVSHGLGLYPARIALDPILTRGGDDSGTVYEAHSSAEFIDTLGKVLKSDETKEIVRALLAQTQSRPNLAGVT